MLKIGINSAPRIVPAEVTETQESPVQQNLEQQSIPEAKPITAANTSIRAEAMFSEFAMRSQLTQQLARNESMNNPTSLKQITPVELQAPLTQAEAEQQIENQPTYIKPLTADEAGKGELLPKTLYTGDGDDEVDIKMRNDGLVYVNVNGKDAWSGTYEQFQALTIDTGAGNDVVYNNNGKNFFNPFTGKVGSAVNGAKISTGEGNDVVWNQGNRMIIDTGSGADSVISHGDDNEILLGDGNDRVEILGDDNDINTGEGNDFVDMDRRFSKGNVVDGERQE